MQRFISKYLGFLLLIGFIVVSSGPGILAQDSGGKSIIEKSTIRIINLGPSFNYEGVDYAPTVSADGRTLFFVSDREGSKLSEDDDLTHDFWAARKNHRLDTVFFAPYNIDTTTHLGKLGVNTSFNEGAASVAADRQTLYFTACNKPDGMGDCDVYRTTIEGDKWSRPTNLGRNVNSKGFDSQPSIAPDQSRVYFVSTREGPNSNGDPEFENFDIWYSDWDADIEEWKPAKNLTAINTPGRDASPFIAADNVTLFFASEGHQPNFGGLDFYYTRYDPDTDVWATPISLGEPINTDLDEYFITLPASGDIIYFSSRREDLAGYQGNLDVFMAFVPTFFRTVIVRGTVVDECSGEFIPASISIRNPITGKVFTDSLTDTHTQFELIVANQDYGPARDSLKAVTLEISAQNPKYGKKMKALRVKKPAKTEDIKETEEHFNEYEVKITLGQKPILGSIIDEADYVRRSKENKPEIASFRGLVMEEYLTWEIYPLLNYVFFELGAAKLLDRYILFDNPAQTASFNDTTIVGGTLDKYYKILNIIGYRMNKFSNAKIEVVGCNDGTFPEEKSKGKALSKERAQLVYDYFKNVWKIDEKRMKFTVNNKPRHPSNVKDSLGVQENRRVEIISKEWEIIKPVFEKYPKTFPQPEQMDFTLKNGIEDALIAKRRIEIMHGGKMWKVITDVGTVDPRKTWDWQSEMGKYPKFKDEKKTIKDEDPFIAKLIVTTKSGAECASDPIEIPVMQVLTTEKRVQKDADSTLENYSLILFPFDSPHAGPLNERIMRDYVYNRILPSSVITVEGHTDVVGLYEHNQKLSVRRSGTVFKGITKKTRGKYAELTSQGVGEDEPLYDNALPEGRFYNRTVKVIIRTPVEAWENFIEE